MSLEWENEMKDAGEEAEREEESKKMEGGEKNMTQWQRRRRGKQEGFEVSKRLREEPLGMSTQQKCGRLVSAVGTQFKRVCCLTATHSNTNISKSQTKSGERKKKPQKTVLALWAKTAEKFKYILFPRYLMETVTFFYFLKNTYINTYINVFL